MTIHRLGFAFALAVLCVPSAAWACKADRSNFVWGSDAETHMAVRTTESCRFGFKVNSRGHMDSVVVAQPPQHGSLTPIDATHWLYHPVRGYTGQDSITVRASGNQMGNRHNSSGDTNITWTVDVMP